jgi:hypothetical protein
MRICLVLDAQKHQERAAELGLRADSLHARS